MTDEFEKDEELEPEDFDPIKSKKSLLLDEDELPIDEDAALLEDDFSPEVEEDDEVFSLSEDESGEYSY